MKVATRLVTGSSLLLALFGGAVAYQLSLVHRMAALNRDLVATRFQAAVAALDLTRRLDELEEYGRKFLVTHDVAYAERVTEARAACARDLAELGSLAPSGDEATVILSLDASWRRFPLAVAPADEIAEQLDGLGASRVEQGLVQPIAELHRQAWTATTTIQNSIESRVADSTRATRSAERISLAVVAAACVLGGAVVILTVRSIDAPLRRLTEATRIVAQGDFSQRLETGRGDEFSLLAADFNSMVDRLGELDRLKRRFISHVSHELKTPLVAMQETNRLLLEGTTGPLTEKQRRLLELNLQGAGRLAAMIANLLDLSRAEAGAMTYGFASNDLAALVERAAADFEALAGERGVRLEVRPSPRPVVAECDADRTLQVLHNLLDNALKFSPPGATVGVAADLADPPPAGVPQRVRRLLAAAPRDCSYARLAVSDHGPGVADADKEAIFERFHQLDGGRSKPGGVGLGLAICREIVRAHGGSIWIADTPGGGCTAMVLLPQRRNRGSRLESRST